MKSANDALIAVLANNDEFLMAELFTFTLQSGNVYRWTTADKNITYGGQTYLSNTSLIKRNTIKNTIGTQVSTLALTLYPSVNDLVGGIKLSTAIFSFGYFDSADVDLRKVFFSSWAGSPIGDLILFKGRVSDVAGTGTEIVMNVKSRMELLNVQIPRNVYQSSCMNSVYDDACGAAKSSFVVSGYVTSGFKSGITTTVSNPDNYFSQGSILFTSGLNSGIKRTVKAFYASSGTFTFDPPLPNNPLAGDEFQAWPGCDSTQATCNGKFGNVIHFRGTPFIPVPETAV